LGLQATGLADLGVEERLTDAPRCGAPRRITAARVSLPVHWLIGLPISQWTGREIAAEIVARGIVSAISPRHAERLLKRGSSSPTASAIG